MKFDWHVLRQHGIEVAPIDDTLLLSYVLDAGRTDHGMDVLSQKYFGHKPIQFGAVAGTGRSFIGFARVAIDKATEYAAEDTDVTLRLWRRAEAAPAGRAHDERLRHAGAADDGDPRRAWSGAASRSTGRSCRACPASSRRTMARLEAEIYEVAGESFNLGSPKQLGDILFGSMGLPGARKTATGAWSTAPSVLDDLAEQGNPFAGLVLEWRQVSKLKATYTDALPTYVNAHRPRPHLLRARRHHDRPAVVLRAQPPEHSRAQRGRPQDPHAPSSPRPGTSCVRRLLADRAAAARAYGRHPAAEERLRARARHPRDDGLRDVRRADGGDDADVRRRAKAINFGIIYGISAFGLANQLGIPREEAGAYIKQLLRALPRHPRLHGRDEAACRSRATSRRCSAGSCHYPRITASNPSERAFNERAAINAPIQGTAADIIRRAMIRMDAALEADGSQRACCCRCTTSWSSRCRTTRSRRRSPWCARHGGGAPSRRRRSRAAAGRSQGGANWDEAH